MRANHSVGRLTLLLAFAAFGTDALAQAPVQSFADLQSVLQVGQKILVISRDGIRIPGTVVSIAGSELEIKQALLWFERNKRTIFDEASVKRIEVADSTLNGILIGAGLGVLAGWAIIANAPPNDEGESLVLGSLSPMAGGLLGMWIDERVNRLLYASARGNAISMKLFLGPARVGVMMTVGFRGRRLREPPALPNKRLQPTAPR